MSEAPETRTSFGARGKGAASGQRERLDLGKPRYLIRNADGSATWLFCRKCGAQRNQHGPGYNGGYLYLLRKDQTGREINPRTAGIVFCDCALGQARRRGYQKYTGESCPTVDKFQPDRLIGPPETRHGEIAGPFGNDDPPADHDVGKDLKPASDDQIALELAIGG